MSDLPNPLPEFNPWEACAKARERVVILETKVAELEAELSAIRRGEFVCQKCGLRKDSEFERGDF